MKTLIVYFGVAVALYLSGNLLLNNRSMIERVTSDVNLIYQANSISGAINSTNLTGIKAESGKSNRISCRNGSSIIDV